MGRKEHFLEKEAGKQVVNHVLVHELWASQRGENHEEEEQRVGRRNEELEKGRVPNVLVKRPLRTVLRGRSNHRVIDPFS